MASLQLHRLEVDHLPLTVAARFLADSKLLEEGPKFGEHLAGDETPAGLSAARFEFVDVTDAEISLVIEIPVIKQVAGSQGSLT